jgi:hypothetical protein
LRNPRQQRRTSPSRSTDALRAQATTDLEVLEQAAAALRGQLKTFETAIGKARRHLERGGTATELHGVVDIATARAALTRAAVAFEAVRHNSRLSVFRAQAAEGRTVAAIARDWGFSRQLVSRMMKENRRRRPS